MTPTPPREACPYTSAAAGLVLAFPWAATGHGHIWPVSRTSACIAGISARFGWGGRIRTFNLLIQSQLRYRCATPQQVGSAAYSNQPQSTLPAAGFSTGS